MKFYLLFISIILGCVAAIGDKIVFKSKLSENQIYRAFADNIIHSLIGALSCIIYLIHEGIYYRRPTFWAYVAMATIMASFIDLDHFIVAKSFHLKDLKEFKYRGFLHCTTLCSLLFVMIITVAHTYSSSSLDMIGWIWLISFTSHHVRDANRRGLWCFPFGSTPPIPDMVYVALNVMLPHIFSYFHSYLKVSQHIDNNYTKLLDF